MTAEAVKTHGVRRIVERVEVKLSEGGQSGLRRRAAAGSKAFPARLTR
jgi:hypothetical protein